MYFLDDTHAAEIAAFFGPQYNRSAIGVLIRKPEPIFRGRTIQAKCFKLLASNFDTTNQRLSHRAFSETCIGVK